MLKTLSKFIFWVTGWKIIGEMPDDMKKGVIIAAPHTSYWDFLYARAAFFIMGVPMKVTIKKEVVNFPVFGWFARQLGAIAIDRNPKEGGLKRKKSMVDAMVDLVNERDQLIMMITPEGTRKHAPRWKTGFYRVAEGANVPIILGYLDYAKKHAGLGPVIIPSGNYEEDLEKIMDFYRDKTAKYPDQGVL
ncbi:MAG: 1-acyl-sn-glycerol-3-phosphate acyltransferase [Cyclobacteriaceae bacterium]|nr:1-acyl-sn-glycerol-3-phosphate acyltransferase [Cyclobacteriaceae bacterium]